MSGILLQFNTNSIEIKNHIFNKMFSVLEHRGINGSNIKYLKNIAFGCHHYHTTPEEINEIQPLLRKDRDCYLLFEGRLDNREELLRNFRIDDIRTSDAAVILELYCRYGTEFFKDLIGSFVFVVYDNTKKRVVAARDHLGDKTLYHYFDGKCFILASEPTAILRHPDVLLYLNEKKIAEFFSVYEHTDSSSFFKNIYELLPAHFIVFENGKINIQRYWDFDAYKKIRYKKEDEYFDHFSEIFHKSIECRLRTIGEPGVMLSGGFDSTSIATIASRLNNSGSMLKTFSYVFEQFPKSNESKYIDDFCKMYNVESIMVNGDDSWQFDDYWSIDPNYPYQNAYRNLILNLFENVKQNNVKTLLLGTYADELFVGTDYRLKDYISDFQFLNAASETIKLIRREGIRNINHCKPIRILMSPLKFIRDMFISGTVHDTNLFWLTEESKSLLPENLYWSNFTKKYYRENQARLVAGLNTAIDISSCVSCVNGSLLDLRYPFRDRRLVEFFFQIPSYLLYDDSSYKNKYIIRNALKNHLPDSVLNRTEITTFEDYLSYGLKVKHINTIQEIVKEGSSELEPYINMNVLNDVLYNGSKKLKDNDFFILWRSFCFVLWKRKLKEFVS